MSETKASTVSKILYATLFAAMAVSFPLAQTSSAPAAAGAQTQPAPAARRVGKIKAINGTVITLTPDSGPEVNVSVADGTRIRSIAPGETNPKNATPMEFKGLQVGDLIRIIGIASDDGKSIAASSIVALKATDVAARRQQELEDWKKRGSGGIVSAVDPATGTVTITTSSLAGKKTIAIHTTKDTVIRRYAPDSMKYEDAKVGTLQDIHRDDQLRVRGDRNAGGTEIAAEEIATGVFPSFPATVTSVDRSSGIINVQDLQSKKQVQVKVTPDSQLHKLSAEMAQRFAMRLKGATGIAGIPGSGGTGSGGASAGGAGSKAVGSGGVSAGAPAVAVGQGTPPGSPSAAAGRPNGGMGGAMRPGGGDFQQMLSNTPAVSIGDLHKGDAVVLLTTEGSSSAPSTVITLVAGVEPILQAAPSASQVMMLAPWSLGGAPAGGDN